jgi:hypothetical protein
MLMLQAILRCPIAMGIMEGKLKVLLPDTLHSELGVRAVWPLDPPKNSLEIFAAKILFAQSARTPKAAVPHNTSS